MLIEFSVANFRSFREIQTLRLQSAPIKSKKRQLDEDNIFPVSPKLSLVKSKVIFGPNASGKSNLVKAMAAFFTIIRQSFKDENILQQALTPFMLDAEAFLEPSYFQIQFRLDDRNYRYGFEANAKEIVSEWLFSSDDRGHEAYHFKRERDQMEVNPRTFKEAVRLAGDKGEDMLPYYRPNVLFFTLLAANNRPLSAKINQYFSNHYAIYSGVDESSIAAIAMESLLNAEMHSKIVEVLKRSDTGIEGLELVEIPENRLNNASIDLYQKLKSEGKSPMAVVTKRTTYNTQINQNVEIFFPISEESYGTQKMFWLSPFLINTLENGGILVIDEFGSSLHVRLIRAILDLFHSKSTNPLHAQLIVATHDTHLLDQSVFRRDQIAFIDKNKSGQSILTDLVEFKGVRNDASLESDYLHGRYGAVPLVNQFQWAFTPETDGKKRQENGSK
jgi:AAA15 family ATPase/GTPase